MQYANSNGKCVHSNSNDLPNGKRENVLLKSPSVCTRIHLGVIAITSTLELFVSLSFLLIFRSAMHVSLILRFNICRGIPILL